MAEQNNGSMASMTLPDGQAKANKIAYDKAWRAANREKVLAQERARRKANPEKEKEKKRKTYLKHQEKALAYAAKYREENREKIRAAAKPKDAEYGARWRAKHPEKARACGQAWKIANPERRKATQAAYLQNNKARHLANIHNRRARKQAAGGELSKGLADRLYFLQKGKCACCGKPLGGKYELDHIIPLARGGSNTDDNIQLLTPKCNRQKGAKDPVQFMQARGKLI
jgi:5-methylcytosine-specific restriction endonuclease McrA